MTSKLVRRAVTRLLRIDSVRRIEKLRRRNSRLGAMIGAVALTSVFPPTIDRPVTAVLARGFVRVRRRRVLKASARMTKMLGGNIYEWFGEGTEFSRMRCEVRWARARGAGLRAGTPDFTVQGGDHLHAAHAEGKGVILWRIPFTTPTPLNASIQQAGIRMVHLTSEEHMLEDRSWLSRRVIGPLNTRDEARFTDRRVTRSKSGPGGYLKELSKELGEGSAVSIVGLSTIGRASVVVDVGRISLRVPTGAPSLAFSTGAALIPCAVVREGPFRWNVVFLAPIKPEAGQNRREFRVAACHQFASEVEALARAETSSVSLWGRTD